MKISLSTNISRSRLLMLCCTGLAEQVAKVARDALQTPVLFPSQVFSLRLKLVFLLGKDAEQSWPSLWKDGTRVFSRFPGNNTSHVSLLKELYFLTSLRLGEQKKVISISKREVV